MINKDTILSPHHLWREEEPKTIKCEHCDDGIIKIEVIRSGAECCGGFDKYGGCCNNPIQVPIQDVDIDQCSECHATGHENFQALTAYKEKYPDRPEYEWKRFKDEMPKNPCYLLDSSRSISLLHVYNCLNQKMIKIYHTHWCDKEEHDAKVSKWEASQVLYEGFEKDGLEQYRLGDIIVEFNGEETKIRNIEETYFFGSENGVTLHQFEAVTGLKMKEI